MDKISGVYKITNIKNNKMYIGESCDIDRRWSEHIDNLECKSHYNLGLQKDWNEFGKENFKFEILEIIEDKDKTAYILTMERIYREGYYINQYNSIKYGYNQENTFEEIIKGNKFKISERVDKAFLLKLQETGILSNEEKEKIKKAKTKERRKNKTKINNNDLILEYFKTQCQCVKFEGYVNCKKFFENMGVNVKKLIQLLIENKILLDKIILSEDSVYVKNKNFIVIPNYNDEGINCYNTVQIDYKGFQKICNLIYQYTIKENRLIFTQRYISDLGDLNK